MAGHHHRCVDVYFASIGMGEKALADYALVAVNISLIAPHNSTLNHVVEMKG